jgi:hypothetical protein
MESSDISWPDLTPPPINLWSLPYSFEQAAHRHPSLFMRRLQLMQHLELMQGLLSTKEEGADSGEAHRGGSDDHED